MNNVFFFILKSYRFQSCLVTSIYTFVELHMLCVAEIYSVVIGFGFDQCQQPTFCCQLKNALKTMMVLNWVLKGLSDLFLARFLKMHKFRKDLLSIYWNLLEKEDGEKCERWERIATQINVKYTCSNHWIAGLGGRALRNVKFQWTALKLCSCCANTLSCKVTFRYPYENLRRIPLNVRAISAKNIYQKTTHSTVTF